MPGKGQIKAFAPCPGCGEDDPKKFGNDKARGCKLRKFCRACWIKKYYDPEKHKEYKRKFKYGITNEQYEQLLASQHGLCAVCGKPPNGTDQHKILVVDHDHETNQVRGLIHGRCNTLLGDCGEDTAVLVGAIAYLNRFEK
jgi:hypothetical protein